MTSSFERRAIDGFVAHLQNSGLRAEVVCYPEERSEHPLMVDGELLVDGESWAVDHMRVSREPATIPAIRDIEAHLKPELDELATMHQVALSAVLFPPRLGNDQQAKSAWRKSVHDLAEEAIGDLGITKHDQNNTSITAMMEVAEPSATISTWSSDDPLVENQVRSGTKDSLLKKFRKQLPIARGFGYKTILLLDQMDPIEGGHPSIWIAAPETIAIVVEEVIKEANFEPDQIWLRTGGGKFQRLPTSPSPIQL